MVYFASEHFRDEVVSWVIEIWMKKHLVSGNNCNVHCKFITPKFANTKSQIMARLTFSVGDTP